MVYFNLEEDEIVGKTRGPVATNTVYTFYTGPGVVQGVTIPAHHVTHQHISYIMKSDTLSKILCEVLKYESLS